MQKLLIITIIMFCAVTLQAAQLFYQFPDATKLTDGDRLMIYQPISSNLNKGRPLNLTGRGLQNIIHRVAWPEGSTRVFQAVTSTTISNQIVNVVRDRRGVIRHMMYESGSQFYGTPGYNHTYVYPFNGMTNVSRTTPVVVGSYWLTRGFVGREISIQGGPDISPKALVSLGVINGLPYFDFVNFNATDQFVLDAWYWGINATPMLAANTTYTIRSAMPRSWGSTGPVNYYGLGNDPCTYTLANTSSARVMNNYSGDLCRSTFRTGL